MNMRKNLGAKPYTYPQPVFILAAYDESGKPDAMNAAWGGISDGDELSMCISAGHKTTKNLLNRKAFTVSMADVKNVVACDYVGIVSGNTEPNKFEKSGFRAVECRLRSYDPASGRLVGEIVNVSVDERVLDANGKVDVEKVQPITFDPFNNTYVALGKIVGTAFSDGKELK